MSLLSPCLKAGALRLRLVDIYTYAAYTSQEENRGSVRQAILGNNSIGEGRNELVSEAVGLFVVLPGRVNTATF